MSLRIDHIGVFESQVRKLLAGLQHDFLGADEQVIFAGKPMLFSEVVATLQRMLDSFSAVHAHERALRQAISERRRAMTGHRSTYADAVLFLKHHLGRESSRLALFGVSVPKEREPMTAQAKAIARAKAAATRKRRGTLTKRQRMALGRPPEPTLQVVGADGKPLVAAQLDAPADPEPSGAE